MGLGGVRRTRGHAEEAQPARASTVSLLLRRRRAGGGFVSHMACVWQAQAGSVRRLVRPVSGVVAITTALGLIVALQLRCYSSLSRTQLRTQLLPRIQPAECESEKTNPFRPSVPPSFPPLPSPSTFFNAPSSLASSHVAAPSSLASLHVAR